MYRCYAVQMAIVMIMSVAPGYGAAGSEAPKSISPSMQRVMLLLQLREPGLQGSSKELYEGIDYFFGLNGKEQDHAQAEKKFSLAKNHRFSALRKKARLYDAARMFYAGSGIKKDCENAFREADATFIARDSILRDRVRAYILIDEIFRTFPEEKGLPSKLFEYSEQIEWLTIETVCCSAPMNDCCLRLRDELSFRLARNYWHFGSPSNSILMFRARAIFYCNKLFNATCCPSLMKDVQLLWEQIPSVMQGEAQVLIEPEASSGITLQDPFHDLYDADSSDSSSDDLPDDAVSEVSFGSASQLPPPVFIFGGIHSNGPLTEEQMLQIRKSLPRHEPPPPPPLKPKEEATIKFNLGVFKVMSKRGQGDLRFDFKNLTM